MDIADFVLQKFSNEEQSTLPEFLNKAGDALEAVIFDGLSKASSKWDAWIDSKGGMPKGVCHACNKGLVMSVEEGRMKSEFEL